MRDAALWVSRSICRSVLLGGLIVGISACSPFSLARCEEGASVADRTLADLAVEKIVRQSQASTSPDEVKYASAGQFHQQNPDCCFVSRPADFRGGTLSLPLQPEVELTIRYRRFSRGTTPFRLRYVAVGPCPSDMDDTEQRQSPQQHEESKKQILGRAIA